jgi:hypothetical protein
VLRPAVPDNRPIPAFAFLFLFYVSSILHDLDDIQRDIALGISEQIMNFLISYFSKSFLVLPAVATSGRLCRLQIPGPGVVPEADRGYPFFR